MAIPPNITVQVDADTAKALAEIVAFSKAAQASLDNINANIQFDRDRNDKEADAGGRSAGKKWWQGFDKESEKGGNAATSRFKRLFQKWSAIVVAFGEDIAVALYGAGGALASISASLVQAIGSIGVLTPVIAGLGAAIGTIVIGSAGLSDGFSAVNEELKAATKEGRAFNVEAEGIQDALKGLAPSAQEFVKAFAGVREQFAVIQEFVQQRLFEGFGDALTRIASNQLPAIQSGLGSIASTLNTAFLDLFETVGSFNLGGLLSSWTPLISNIAGALAPLSAAFLSFLETATPFAITLSEQFANWAENLADFVQSSEGTKAIEDFLTRSLDSLNSWLDLIGSIGSAFGSFLDIAADNGDSLIDSLTKVVDKFDEWINKNPEKVEAFLETSERIVKALGPLLKGLAGAFDALVSEGAVSRFEDLAATLGEILPLLGELLGAASETNIINVFADAILGIGKALKESGAIDAISRLGKVIGESLGNVLQAIVDSGALDTLATGIALIADTVGELLSVIFSDEELLTAFKDGLAAVADTIVILLPELLRLVATLGPTMIPALTGVLELLPPLAALIEALMPAITLVVDAMVLWLGIQAELFGFIQTVVLGVIETLIGWLTSLVDIISGAVVSAIEGLSSAWKATSEDITAFYNRNISPIVYRLRGWAANIRGIWDGLWEAMLSIYDEFLGDFVSDISDAIGKVVGFFEDFEDNVGEISDSISSTVEAITGFFEDIPKKIGDAFRRAYEKAKEYVDKIKNLPGSIASGVGGFVGNLNPFANNARGAIVTQATKMIAGEAGREAVIPLDRPLAQIDPSVRMMAALLRGEGPRQTATTAPAAARPAMVNNWTINDMTGNAEATAQKVINRLALV